jgi:ABC-type multidrug transport system fused ATPase/permease subunit
MENRLRAFRKFIPAGRERHLLVIATVSLLGGVILQLPLPLVTRYVIDNVLPHKSHQGLNLVILILMATLILKGVADILHRYWISLAREHLLIRTQLLLFKHIQTLDMSFFRGSKSGYLTARINNDVSSFGGFLNSCVTTFLSNVMTLLVGIVVIVSLDWKLALLCVLIVPLFLISLCAFSTRLRECARRYQESFAIVWDTLHESLSQMDTVRGCQAEGRESKRLERALQNRLSAIVRLGVTSSLSAFSTGFVAGLGPLVVLWYGGTEVMSGKITLGTLVAFSSFVGYLFNPMKALADLNNDLQQALASAERVNELFAIVPTIFDSPCPVQLREFDRSVSIRNVTFGYEEEKPVLTGLNLEVGDGEIVALVGKSGAGKSSLINLIPRFHDPTAGSVHIGDVDIRMLRLADLRKMIGLVPQDVVLFAGSIRENLLYGAPSASNAEVSRALDAANAAEFVERLPLGLETVVGERGAKLSGGQRQRLAIARALLRNPQLLILDEATSEVDGESEYLIQKSIREISRQRTTLVVAHRLATVVTADRIALIDSGKVLECGSHRVLLARSELYRSLCQGQLIAAEVSENAVSY